MGIKNKTKTSNLGKETILSIRFSILSNICFIIS